MIKGETLKVIILWSLTGTFAFFRFICIRDVCGAVAIGAHGAVGDPGLIHAALHSLHDEVKQNIHSLAHVLSICCAGLKVWNSV